MGILVARLFIQNHNPRRGQGKRYQLKYILLFSIPAILSGEKFYQDAAHAFLTFLSCTAKPHLHTLSDTSDIKPKGRKPCSPF